MRYVGFGYSSASLTTTFNVRSDGHWSVELSLVQITHVSTISSGHSFWQWFFLQHGQNIAKPRSALACFFLSCENSNCVVNVPKMSILKSSKGLPISIRVTPHPGILLVRVRESLIPDFFHIVPGDYLIHNLTILSYSSLEISPFPIKLSVFIHSSSMPLFKVVFNTSFGKVV